MQPPEIALRPLLLAWYFCRLRQVLSEHPLELVRKALLGAHFAEDAVQRCLAGRGAPRTFDVI